MKTSRQDAKAQIMSFEEVLDECHARAALRARLYRGVRDWSRIKAAERIWESQWPRRHVYQHRPVALEFARMIDRGFARQPLRLSVSVAKPS